MQDFDQLTNLDKKGLIQRTMQMDYQASEAKSMHQRTTKDALSILPDKNKAGAVVGFIHNNFKISANDRRKLRVAQSLMTKIFLKATYLDKKDPDVPVDSLKASVEVGQTMGSKLQEDVYIATSRAQNMTNAKCELIILLGSGQMTRFLENFFMSSDTRSGMTNRIIVLYVRDIIKAEKKVLLNDHEPIALQQFYDKQHPKNVRGQLMQSSNPIFKDTDDLNKFLKQYFFLD